MKRIFLAIDVVPDHGFLKELEYMQNELHGEHIKWVNFKQLHLTLKFFGETEEAQINDISDALSGTLTTRETKIGTVKTKESFRLSLSSLGVFRNMRHPQVIWIGCDKPEGLMELKNAIDWALEPLGIRPENRDFSPHFTIGRIKHLRNMMTLNRLIEKYRHHTFYQQDVNTLVMYESILSPQGPEYNSLKTWALILR